MRYRIVNHSDSEFDVYTEDGGVASVHHTGEDFVTTYFQRSIDIEDAQLLSHLRQHPEDLWTYLSEGEVYIKHWDGSPSHDEMIKDALSWLVVPAPYKFIQDDKLFTQIIDKQ